jgi:hypothetical protein
MRGEERQKTEGGRWMKSGCGEVLDERDARGE